MGKRTMAFLVSFAIIGGLLAIGQAYFIATIVDRVFLKGASIQEVSVLLFLLLLIFVGRGLLSYVNSNLGIRVASNVKTQLRKRLLNKVSKSEPGFLFEQKTGKHVGVLTDAVDQIQDYYSSFLPLAIQASIIPLIVLVTVFTHNIYSGIIMLVTAPLIPVFMIIIGSMTEKKSREQLDSMLRFSGHFLDVLQGLPVLKVFGQSKRQRQEIVQMSNHFRDTTMAVLKIAFLSALMLEILATISTAMIAVEVGLRLVYDRLTFHTAFFVLLLAPELYMPLKNLGTGFHAGRNSAAAAEAIWETLDKQERKTSWGNQELEIVDPPAIKINDLSFYYKDDRPVVSNIHLDIKSGEKVALVGKSGAGKTTLLKVLLGLLPPNEGRITVNNIPLTNIKEDSWLANIAYVSQEPYLFAGTISENILMAKPEATKEEMIQAAKMAGVDRFVDQLPSGYETTIGEAGQGLSGGEKQRVAVARAFLKKASIVLLDEPTAGLDLETEHYLKQAIAILCQSATVITVAHRLQTIIDADQIILLSSGEIVASGTHHELIDSSDHYRSIVSVYRGESK